jgi:hypothetical protein
MVGGAMVIGMTLACWGSPTHTPPLLHTFFAPSVL